MADDVVLELGWGRLIFGQTFADPGEAGRGAAAGGARPARHLHLRRANPTSWSSQAPAELFIDPSHTYRLRFTDDRRDCGPRPPGSPCARCDAGRGCRRDEPRLRALRDGARADVDDIWHNHRTSRAVDLPGRRTDDDGAVVGTVTGVDHELLFGDPESGSSLWTLAVDPTAGLPGHRRRADPQAGRALPSTAGRAYMDLSVTHDNAAAIALYEKLGFARVPVLASSARTPINEPLFTPGRRRPSTTSTPTRGSSPTRRCGAGSGWRCSTPRPARCGCPRRPQRGHP